MAVAPKNDDSIKMLEMRRATCPNPHCRLPLLFTSSTKFVKCNGCLHGEISTSRLSNVVEASSIREETKWLQDRAALIEKTGGMCNGRAQMASRMVDGVSGHHHIAFLWDWFEQFGVNEKREAEKLSKMKFTEPIDVAMMSDYAFGIRKRDLFVAEYGCDRTVLPYLTKPISEINRINGIKDDANALVPMRNFDQLWSWSSAYAISKVCVGREVFGRRLQRCVVEHIGKYSNEYKTRSPNDRAIVESIKTVDNRRVIPTKRCMVDLAAIANLLRRPIVLLGPEPPYVVELFVPFMHLADDCRDRRGLVRSPLVLARIESAYSTCLVGMVAMASRRSISEVYLPRSWFLSVWGFETADAGELIRKYLEFDKEDRCLVANGKYFKPQHMRLCVKAFDKASLISSGVVTFIQSDYAMRNKHSSLAEADMFLISAAANGNMWRCIQCENTTITDGTAPDACTACQSSKYLRPLNVDGTIKYKDGDHTWTPAPASWCCFKRKHYWNGREYDNPPRIIPISFKADRGSIRRGTVAWFGGESKFYVRQAVSELARSFGVDEHEEMALEIRIEKEINAQLTDEKLEWKHRMNHFRAALGDLTYERLMDAQDESIAAAASEPKAIRRKPKPKPKLEEKQETPEDIDSVFRRAQESYDNYQYTLQSLLAAKAQGWGGENTDALIKASHVAQEAIDKQTVEYLDEMVMSGLTREERWRRIFSKEELFRRGGFYHLWATRKEYKKPQHFKLPLLLDTKFTFDDQGDHLVACVFGEHLPISPTHLGGLCMLLGMAPTDSGFQMDEGCSTIKG